MLHLKGKIQFYLNVNSVSKKDNMTFSAVLILDVTTIVHDIASKHYIYHTSLVHHNQDICKIINRKNISECKIVQ
jgi:hypothetical protein